MKSLMIFMKKSVGLSLCIFLLPSLAVRLDAQEGPGLAEPPPLSVGVLGGFWLNAYAGELDVGSDIRLGGGACAVVGGGTGSGATFGAFAEYRTSPTLAFGMRALFEDRSGAMTDDLPTAKHRLANGELEDVESQYRFELDLQVLSLEPYASLHLFSFPLRLTAGPKIGFTSSSAYEFAEELGGDNEQAFANGTKRLDYASGQVDRTLLFGLTVGAGYELSMAEGLMLIPEITFSSYLNSPLPGESGPIVAGVRPSVSFHYTFSRPAPEPPPLPVVAEPAPPPAPPEPELVADVAAYGIASNGESRDDLLLIAEERVRRREIALLPYIFFAENSAEIPQRYINPDSSGEPTIVERYRNLLNLLGYRLQKQPDATVTLVGTNANEGEEKGNLEISRARAERIASYLTSQWGIDPGRMKIEARNLPESPSNPTLPGGREENRRVEIHGAESLLAPMIVEDTIRNYTSPGFRIAPASPTDLPLRSYEVEVNVNGANLRRFRGAQLPKEIVVRDLSEEEVERISRGENLTYSLRVTADNGETFRTESRPLAIETERIRRDDILLDDQSVSISTPVLFAYNSAQINGEDRDALIRFRRDLPDGASLTITGYADDLGESSYNRSLSQRRAEEVAKLFSDYPVTIVAAGEQESIGGENTPEGRFYARTVSIEVTR